MKMRIEICTAIALASSLLTAVSYAGPQAVVEGKTSAEFGSYPAKEPKTAVFTILNKGNFQLKIVGVRNSCECVDSGIVIGNGGIAKNGEIPSGGKGLLRLEVLPDSIHEPYNKTVYVQTDDPENKFLIFTISGDAIPIAKALPHAELNAGHIKLGATWQHELNIVAMESGVEFGKPQVEGIPLLAKLEQSDAKTFTLRMELSPQEEATGRISGRILIPVLKPEGWKPLETPVVGFIGTELLASPAKIIIPDSAENTFAKDISISALAQEQIGLDAQDISALASEGVSVKISGHGETLLAHVEISSATLSAFEANTLSLEFRMKGAKALKIPLLRR